MFGARLLIIPGAVAFSLVTMGVSSPDPRSVASASGPARRRVRTFNRRRRTMKPTLTTSRGFLRRHETPYLPHRIPAEAY
jgi:hypothetical protein